MDFESYFKVNSLVSVRPKSIILDQMTNLNMIFYAVVSVYRFVKFWNSPQFPAEFWNSQLIFPAEMNIYATLNGRGCEEIVFEHLEQLASTCLARNPFLIVSQLDIT